MEQKYHGDYIPWMVKAKDDDDELARLRTENESLRNGAQLGLIIGAATILKQEIELKRLRMERDEQAQAIGGQVMESEIDKVIAINNLEATTDLYRENDRLQAEVERSNSAYETLRLDVVNLTEKVIPNIREQAEAEIDRLSNDLCDMYELFHSGFWGRFAAKQIIEANKLRLDLDAYRVKMRALVEETCRITYNYGFSEGMREVQTSKGGQDFQSAWPKIQDGKQFKRHVGGLKL